LCTNTLFRESYLQEKGDKGIFRRRETRGSSGEGRQGDLQEKGDKGIGKNRIFII